jgi:HlyD family secretion protein
VPVSRGAIERRITATGTVNPVLTIIIGSYVSGVISSMSCDYNTRVRKGQLCAKIDPRPYQAAFDQVQGQLKRDSSQLAGARTDLERYKESLARNAIAKQVYDDQVALVQQLEGSVQADRGALDSARVNLEYTNIISPVDGTVVARNITIGQTVAASFQTPTLFLIATDLTKMQVDTNVSESDIGSVKEGESANFSVEAYTDRSFSGSVVQVRQAPQTVQNVVTYDVVVGVDNPQFLLKPGMTATVGIVTDRRSGVLRIPDQALRFMPSGAARPTAGSATSGGTQVWLLRDGKPVPMAVRIGLDDDTYSELLDGRLQVNNQVIIGEQREGGSARSGAFRFGF